MTEMERRCATALAKARRCAFEDDAAECKPNAGEAGFVCFCLRDARTVIRCLRDPTEDMEKFLRSLPGWPPRTPRAFYQAAIDAAAPPE